jgi:hypothetical protein
MVRSTRRAVPAIGVRHLFRDIDRVAVYLALRFMSTQVQIQGTAQLIHF